MAFNPNSRAYSVWTWIVLAVVAAAVVHLLLAGRWLGVGVLSGFIAVSVTFIRSRDRLPRVFNLLFIVAGVLNAGAYVFDLWQRIGVYDAVVHAYTTFAVAAAFGYVLLQRTPLIEAGRRWRFVAAVAAFGLCIGIVWEVFEYLIGIIGDRLDTAIDLVMDTIGASAAGLFCAWAADQRRGESESTWEEAAKPRT